MRIRYLGHSSFAITDSAGLTVVTDPFGDVGFLMPRVRADAVTVSHAHFDHCNVQAVEGSPVVFDKSGSCDWKGISIRAIETAHDDCGGKKRGKNLVFRLCMDGITVCHLGDLGEDCTESLVKSLLPVDVLLIPVGGTYTITAEKAKEYVDAIKPKIVIPMHYQTEGLNLAIGGVEAFTKQFAESPDRALFYVGSDIELNQKDIKESGKEIIVMERVKEWI